MTNYVYIQSEPRLWTVGFYRPDGKWEPESDHASPEGAAQRASVLNGGPGTATVRYQANEGSMTNTKRHPDLAIAAETGSTELAVFSLAYMLDDRLQELTAEVRTLNATLAKVAEYTDYRGLVESSR